MVPNIKPGQNGVREPETLCSAVEMAVGLVSQCHYLVSLFSCKLTLHLCEQ